jgi:hypothetical protein
MTIYILDYGRFVIRFHHINTKNGKRNEPILIGHLSLGSTKSWVSISRKRISWQTEAVTGAAAQSISSEALSGGGALAAR